MLKKIILTIIFSSFCIFPAFSATPVWQRFDSGPNIEMYVDRANIAKNENYAVIWTKDVLPNYYNIMQWLITRDGYVSCIYSKTYRPDGKIDERFPGSRIEGGTTAQSDSFKELYHLVW